MAETNSATSVMERPKNTPARREAPSSINQNVLPIELHEKEIENGIRSHDNFFLMGHPGSGKSTYGPEYLLKSLLQEKPSARIVVTQPRRIAVEEISTRLTQRLGQEIVGFRHGGANRANERTRITVMPDASLLNELSKDPLLRSYDGVMVDEAHEENNDMLLNFGFLKKAQRERKKAGLKPLKVVIATATFDKEKHMAFHENAGEVEVEGKMFPVTEHFIDDEDFISSATLKQTLLSGIQMAQGGGVSTQDIPLVAGRLAASLIKDTDKPGDIIIILPGRAEIEEAQAEFKRLNPGAESVVLVGGDNESGANQRIHHADDTPIAFFATSVVEASVTIDKATKVIDAGLSRGMYYDPETGITSLQTVPHAKSNYKQRIGRAGRVQPGDSYALFSREELDARADHLPAEILRTDLAALTLRLKSMGVDDIHSFDFLDHPGKERLDQAVETLFYLGALDENGKITADGLEMSKIPLDPHYSRMLVEAKKSGCAEQVSLLVGFLSSRNSVFMPLERGVKTSDKYKEFIVPGSDFLTLLNIWNEFISLGNDREKSKRWAQEKGIRRGALIDALRMKSELSREESLRESGVTREHKEVDLSNGEQIIKCVIAGLADKMLSRIGNSYRLADGKKGGIVLGNTSVLSPGEAAHIVSGNIRTVERTRTTYATINQVISAETYNMLLERMGHKKEMAEAEKKLEEVAQEKEEEKLQQEISAEKKPEQTSPQTPQAPIAQSPQKVPEHPPTFFAKIKNSITGFFKKFLGL